MHIIFGEEWQSTSPPKPAAVVHLGIKTVIRKCILGILLFIIAALASFMLHLQEAIASNRALLGRDWQC